jgi:benzoyl-CoA reductase/2-hydroxyglutaryl-CoA dehydratase subunit BcrC/BadD/HgdB
MIMEKQFEKKESLLPEFSENPGNMKRQRFVEDDQAGRQREYPVRPANIEYFENLMYNRDFSIKKHPRVGYFCNMIPQELIWTLDAEPVRLDCGNSAASLIGEEIFSGEICPLAKASFGVFMNPESLANSCDLLILPTSCDAKRKLGEVLNQFKPVFMYNLPPEQNHSLYAKQTFQETLRMAEWLGKHLKTRLSTGKLRQAVQWGLKRTGLIRELQELRSKNPRSLSPADFFLIIQTSLFRPVDMKTWLNELEKVTNEVKNLEPERKNLRPRLVLTGAPMVWPNFKVLNVFEESGADIIADTLCSGAQSCFDPVIADDQSKKGLLRALTNRYVYASICPCFISQQTRLNRILDLYGENKIDGIINYSLRLCQLFDMENFAVERTVKQRKIPFINVRTDYSLEDTEQLRVRIEAFLETIE